MITVFTPTYNRAYILSTLYKSLCTQTYKEFEWIIVDDGSSDNTEELVEQWKRDHLLNLVYVKQTGGGKHRAINRGVNIAKGELFFIVDSDDYLQKDALERIVEQYNLVREDKSYAGVCGLKCYPNGKVVGKNKEEQDYTILGCNAIEYRHLYRFKGDRAEVFRTEILKKYPFPDIEGERFCPEALIWNRIALNYNLSYFWGKIYMCDYLQDGLTAKITRIRMESPMASILFYSELLKMDIPFVDKLKSAINYYRFYACIKNKNRRRQVDVSIPVVYFFLAPLGIFFHMIDKKNSYA